MTDRLWSRQLLPSACHLQVNRLHMLSRCENPYPLQWLDPAIVSMTTSREDGLSVGAGYDVTISPQQLR